MKTPTLKTQLQRLPASPGIYQFLDKQNKILYIGKAKVLARRVRSYFQKTQQSPRLARLVSQTTSLNFIETTTETEALVLEANLIKEHQPRYNVLLRDDKHYLYIRLSSDPYPTVTTVRRVSDDGAQYFGPKTSSASIRQTLSLIRKIIPHRTCRMQIDYLAKDKVKTKNPDRRIPCLDYHIHRCPGCCLGKITPEDYQQSIHALAAFLDGDHATLTRQLKAQISALATAEKFEQAARIRDQLFAIERLSENQSADTAAIISRDVLNFTTEGSKHYFNLFLIRSGKIIDQLTTTLTGEDTPPELLRAFLLQYYSRTTTIPPEILLPFPPADAVPLQQWLTSLRGSRVRFLTPQRGEVSRLLDLAHRNALAFARQSRARFEQSEPLTELKEKLDLPRLPRRIECYDISHLSGTATVGSMVVFQDAEPTKAHYRHFRIKLLEKGEINDPLSLAEVLRRRLTYLTLQGKNLRLRKARKSDLPHLTQIHSDLSPDTNPQTFTLIEDTQTKQIIATARLVKKPTLTKIANIWTHPDRRGEGLARSVITAALHSSKAAKIYLDCRRDLFELHSSLGFTELKKVPADLQQTVCRRCQAQPTKKPSDYLYMVWQRRTQTPDPSFTTTPDLIILDGGLPQLSTVSKIINLPKKTTLISLAKNHEEIYTLASKKPLQLGSSSPARLLLQRLRDEAHRFANEHRKSLHSSTLTASTLDTIPGLGPKTKQKLLTHFSTIDAIAAAPLPTLAQVTTPTLAQKIHQHFHP